MKWFYVILIATAVAGIAIAVARLTHTVRSTGTQIIVAAAVAVILIALLKFMSKLRD